MRTPAKKTDGWTTATLDLSAYAGQTIAAIALELSATEKVEGYQLNLGRLVVSDGKSYTPAAPTGLTLVNRFDSTGEIQLAWDLGDYSTVKNYHVYAVYADGTQRFVGGAYASNYYIQTLENASKVTACGSTRLAQTALKAMRPSCLWRPPAGSPTSAPSAKTTC